ncbi:MAG: hypothetical protein ABSB19_12170 [Methylomonas sp.]|jgi:hypothetical protein
MNTTTEQRKKIESLIESAECAIQRNPRLYRIKVALLALLGYTVIYAMLFFLIAMLGGLGWAAINSSTLIFMLIKSKLILVLLAMIYVIIRSLWVKFGKPTGYVLQRKDYPIFFLELKQLSKILGAPPIHQVIVGRSR